MKEPIIEKLYYEVIYKDNFLEKTCICNFTYEESPIKIPAFIKRKKTESCTNFQVNQVKLIKQPMAID